MLPLPPAVADTGCVCPPRRIANIHPPIHPSIARLEFFLKRKEQQHTQRLRRYNYDGPSLLMALKRAMHPMLTEVFTHIRLSYGVQ